MNQRASKVIDFISYRYRSDTDTHRADCSSWTTKMVGKHNENIGLRRSKYAHYISVYATALKCRCWRV